MRCLFGFLCVCALGVMPLVGCTDADGGGGAGGDGGSSGSGGAMPECESPEDCDDREECTTDTCVSGMCENTAVEDGTTCAETDECAVGECTSGVCELTPVSNDTACGDDKGTCQDGSCDVACTEQGIRDAIAAGGGPYTFDCDGQHEEVRTGDEIVIDNDVILDGEGNLRVEGKLEHRVFFVDEGVTAELHGLTVAGGGWLEPKPEEESGGCISNKGTLTLTNCWVTECSVPASGNPMPGFTGGGGILNDGTLIMTNCTVSGNTAFDEGGGISNGDTLTMTNCTVSGNTAANRSGGGIRNVGTLMLTNSTVSGNAADQGSGISNEVGTSFVTNSLIDGDCVGDITSNGYNIQSPGNTCGFDQGTDQVNVSAEDLNLGRLAKNGGPTMTHEPKTIPVVSVAIDQIPEADCEVTTDQRGIDRPQGAACDIGAVEWRHCENAEDCDDDYDCTDDTCDPVSGMCDHSDWCI